MMKPDLALGQTFERHLAERVSEKLVRSRIPSRIVFSSDLKKGAFKDWDFGVFTPEGKPMLFYEAKWDLKSRDTENVAFEYESEYGKPSGVMALKDPGRFVILARGRVYNFPSEQARKFVRLFLNQTKSEMWLKTTATSNEEQVKLMCVHYDLVEKFIKLTPGCSATDIDENALMTRAIANGYNKPPWWYTPLVTTTA